MSVDVLIYYLYYHLFLCTTVIRPICVGWLLVLSLYRKDNLQFLNMRHYDNTAFALSLKMSIRKQV